MDLCVLNPKLKIYWLQAVNLPVQVCAVALKNHIKKSTQKSAKCNSLRIFPEFTYLLRVFHRFCVALL